MSKAKIKMLEKEMARVAEMYVRVSWDLTLARAAAPRAIERAAAIRRGEYVPEPSDDTAKAIVAAGRKRRGELQ